MATGSPCACAQAKTTQSGMRKPDVTRRMHQHLGQGQRVDHEPVDARQHLDGGCVMGVVVVEPGDQHAGIGDDHAGHSSRICRR